MRKLAVPAAISLIVVLGALLFIYFSGGGGSESPYSLDTGVVGLESDTYEPAGEVPAVAPANVAAESSESEIVSPADPNATLSGTVRSEFGDPITGADVFLVEDREQFGRRGGDFTQMLRERILRRGVRRGDVELVQTTTDAEGHYAFLLATIPQGSYRVYARHNEYAAAYEPWTWTRESSILDFRLPLGTFIIGVVLDDHDLPIAGARVEAYPDDDRGGGGRGRRGPPGRGRGGDRSLVDKTITNSVGVFRLSLTSGTYRVSADSSEHSANSVGEVSTGTEDLVIVLRPSKQLGGRVVDEQGGALSDAVVSLYSGFRFGRGGFGGFGGGRGRRGGGPRGDPGGRNRGRPGMTRLFSSPRAEVATDASGQFHFTDVPEEGYMLIAEKSGFVTSQFSGTFSEGDSDPSDPAAAAATASGTTEKQVTLTLARAAVLSGVVKSPGGEAVGGVFVAVADDRGDDERFGRGGFGRGGRGFGRGGRGFGGRFNRDGGGPGGEEQQQPPEEAEPPPPEPVSPFSLADGTETDGSGRFTFDTLPPGVYSVSVESDHHPVFREDAIELEKDGERRMEIVLEKGLSLRGKVVSTSGGEPIEKARLNFQISGRQRRSVETDENGEYEVSGLLPGTLREVTVVASGYTEGFFDNVEILEEPETQEYTFELQPGASVAGRVTDKSGNPIYNAQIALTPAIDVEIENMGGFEDMDFSDMRRTFFRRTFSQSERARSNIDGEFLFPDVGGGLSFRLEAEHPDFRSLQSEVMTVNPGESLVGVTLELSMGARIEVLVRDSDGVALPGARVSIERQRTPQEDEAAREQRRQEFERRRAERAQAGEGDGGGQGGGGRRRGPDVREIVQRIVTRGQEDAVRRSRSTGPDGRAIFSGMSGGVYLVRVSESTHQMYYGETTAVEDETVTVTADLLPENVITGIVQDRFGEPVPGAQVEASRIRDNPAMAALAVSTETQDGDRTRGFRDRSRLREQEDARTDEEGRFRIGRLADGTYDLRVRARGFSELRLTDVAVNRDEVIVLQRLGGVAGAVSIVESGLPITTFRARLVDAEGTQSAQQDQGQGPGGFGRGRGGGRGGFNFGGFRGRRGERWRTFNDPAGAFLIENVDPGTYSLEVLADGFAGASVPVRVEDGLITDGVQVALAEGLSIAGAVFRKGTSEPVMGARIYLLNTTPAEGSNADTQRRRRTPSTQRNEDGPQETTGRRTRASRRSAEEEAKLAFATLQQASRGTGGGPLETTDETGYFKLLEVTFGRYMLVVDHDEFVPSRKEIRIDDNRVLPETRIDLDPGETLTGTVTLPDGQSNAGVTVVLQTADGYSRRTQTDAAGRYALSGLITGSYSMSVRATGGLVVKGQKVDIEEGRNTFDYRPDE